jgi:hypothetical protein
MATVPPYLDRLRNGYPESDGKRMAETDWHCDLMVILVEILRAFEPKVFFFLRALALALMGPGRLSLLRSRRWFLQ